MQTRKTIVTGLAAVLVGTTGIAAASDAVLTSVEGVALVSTGESYVTAQAETPLVAGDRVMVMEGGSAVITYTDGCAYTLDDTKVLTISSQSPCDSGQTASQETGQRYAAAAGAVGAGALIPVIAGGAMVIAAGTSDNSNGRTISP